MSKYEVIEKIMNSNKMDEVGKVDTIQRFLLHWLTEDDLKWIWEE